MKLSITIVGAFVASVLALPASVLHVVHEKRSTSSVWSKVPHVKPDSRTSLPVRIGLTQSNLDRGHDVLMDIADPASENYGKHLTADQVADMFAPTQESIDAVQNWLVASGIHSSRVTLSAGRHWLKFNASIAEVEALLHAEYRFYEHPSGQGHIACDDYSVPKSLREHVDLIMPTVHFDVKVSSDANRQVKRRDLTDNPLFGSLPKQGKVISSPGASPQATDPEAAIPEFSLASCDQYITPECLRALYNLPNGTLAQSSYAVVEYTPEAYLQADLNMFFANVDPQIPQGTAPTLASIDGGVEQTTTQSFNDNGEADLDLQYAMALVYPQKVTIYQAGDTIEGASFNTFLDALDASYCTYEGGDNTAEGDPLYPDQSAGGYKKHDCGIYTPTSVISISYAYSEADFPATYEQRQCYEYMKLGMQGVTVVLSSGDTGVSGAGNQCCTKPKCAGGSFNSGAGGTFNPGFPSTCPYVTSVGATQIVPGASVTAPEEACETIIFSGGGFSNVFPLPSYQSSAISEYYTNHKPNYTASQYNNSQAVRGYPDISANGANYVVAVDGNLTQVYGTSASAPVVGSIITLINEQRASAGKKPVGFINPTLYANPSMLNDITSGGNKGCGTPGFTAVTGWDPVSGLGTPDFEKMLPVFMALP